jgi:hypothetical protein
MNPEDNKEFIEGLQVYYRLKQKYEERIRNEKLKIIKMENTSWRQKRNLFRKFIPKCINCNKGGGTLFTTKYVASDNGRRITAVCGNFEAPCSLDIAINLGNIRNVEEILREDEKDIKDLKREIIKDKNDLIFGYIDPKTAADNFEVLKQDLNDTISVYELTLDNYSYTLKKEEHKREIEELKDNIKNDIKTIKDYFSNNADKNKAKDQANNANTIQYIVELYKKVIESNKKLRSILYPIMYVDKDDNKFHLEKREYESLEQNYGNKIGIEKMQVGVGLRNNQMQQPTQQPTQQPIQQRNYVIMDEESTGSDFSQSI